MKPTPLRAAGAVAFLFALSAAPALAQLSPGVVPAAPAEPAPAVDAGELTTDQVIELQTLLTQQGYDTNGIDGIVGPATRAAIVAAQEAFGLPPDGVPTLALLERLRAAPAPIPGEPAPMPGGPALPPG